MQREHVSSSNLYSVGYDNTKNILEVEFISSSRIYQYFDVPEQIYKELMDASSHGQYFNHNIKDMYQYRRIR